MAIPYLNNLDFNNNQALNMRLQNLAAAPPNPLDGLVYYNTASLTAQLYTSGGWITLGHLGEVFTTALLAKLNGIATGATLVADSTTNGNILINGVQNVVYTHPTGTNPHGTTKADVGLGNAENKTAATILAELSSTQIAASLGFAPRKFLDGLDASKPAATGSKILYVATDTGKLYIDNATGSWVQVGGQDTIAWSGITGKPTTFTPPIATPSLLGGIKVGANLTVDANGVLNANSNPASYIIREEEFTISGGQTAFSLTTGNYTIGTKSLEVFIDGVRLPNRVVTETSSTSFTLPAGLTDGSVVFARYLQTINITPYPVHKSEHLTGGTDPIPVATTTADGLMSAVDKVKVNGSYTSAQTDAAISTAINALIAGAPGALDTFNELAAAMGDDPNFATTVTNALANKVDKITGKGLSAEDFTTVLLTKLNGIATGANLYTHPTTDGNKHVPATGTTNNQKVLKAGSTAGSFSWGNVAYGELTGIPSNIAKKYSVAVGTGAATSIPVTHNLNTRDVTVTIRETASPYNLVLTDVQITSVNVITLIFAVAPASGQYTVTVVG